ncbi:hypothetical protein HDU83_004685 [Entophlyctis luteolus]|nr:hypothetical protein HDU83_004685 [Entophlyctis luteolus]
MRPDSPAWRERDQEPYQVVAGAVSPTQTPEERDIGVRANCFPRIDPKKATTVKTSVGVVDHVQAKTNRAVQIVGNGVGHISEVHVEDEGGKQNTRHEAGLARAFRGSVTRHYTAENLKSCTYVENPADFRILFLVVCEVGT